MAELEKNTINGPKVSCLTRFINGNGNANDQKFSSSKRFIDSQTKISLAYLFNIDKASFRSPIGTEKQLTPLCSLKSKTATETKKQCILSLSKLKLKIPKILVKFLNVESHGKRFITRNSSRAGRKRKRSVVKLRSVFSHVFGYDKRPENNRRCNGKQKNMKFNEKKKMDDFNGLGRGDLDWFKGLSIGSPNGMDRASVIKDEKEDTRKTDGNGEGEKSLNCKEKLQQNCMALKLWKVSSSPFNLFGKKASEKSRNYVSDCSSDSNSNSDKDTEPEKEACHLRTMNRKARNMFETMKRVVRMGGLNRGRELWKKPILMGERCQLPDFSGVLHYDEEGNPSTEPPTIRSTNSVLINESWMPEESTIDHDGEKDKLVLIERSRNSIDDHNGKSKKAVFMWERTPEPSTIDYNGERRKNLGDFLSQD